VASECFLAHVFEPVEDVEHTDLVVHGLARQPLSCIKQHTAVINKFYRYQQAQIISGLIYDETTGESHIPVIYSHHCCDSQKKTDNNWFQKIKHAPVPMPVPTVGREDGCGHGVHRGVGDVLEVYRDVPENTHGQI